MRIYLRTTPSTEYVDFNYQHKLSGTLHKWFGKNDFHDAMSLYSFSALTAGEVVRGKLNFPKGALLYVSSWNNELIGLLIDGIKKDPSLFAGMRVSEVRMQENPDFSEVDYFRLGSPIFIQREEAGNKKFYYYNDNKSADFLKDTLLHKMRKAGLPEDDSLEISFDKDFAGKKVKKISYKHKTRLLQIKANWCPVYIKGTPLTKAFAWNVGLGNSTGIGFGSLK